MFAATTVLFEADLLLSGPGFLVEGLRYDVMSTLTDTDSIDNRVSDDSVLRCYLT